MSGRKKRYAPKCERINCTANRNGMCIALDEAITEECPFFRDRKTLTGADRLEYERLADYINVREKDDG